MDIVKDIFVSQKHINCGSNPVVSSLLEIYYGYTISFKFYNNICYNCYIDGILFILPSFVIDFQKHWKNGMKVETISFKLIPRL